VAKDPERLKWGQRNVGIPGLQIREAIERLQRTDEFSSVRYDAIAYYCDRLLFRCLPEELDSALRTEDLKALSPDVTKVVFILLIRDFLRRFHDRLVPADFLQNWRELWVEKFTVKLLALTDAPVTPYVQWLTRFGEDEEEDPALLIAGLARQLGIDAAILWQLHTAMCEVAEEDLLGGSADSKGEHPPPGHGDE
jgi:hypothetical protein